jgi:osmotically-inducible protein OsmY
VTNAELERSVRDELNWDPRIDSAEIAVSANDGTVTLRGTTHTLREKIEAKRATKRVFGVVKVEDHLEPRILERRADNELRGAVLQALMLDSLVPSSVEVEAYDGVVTLTGTAEWRFQRDEAFEVASRVNGVVDVVDEITLPLSTPDAFDVKDAITRAFKRNAKLDAEDLTVRSADGTLTIAGTVSSWAERDEAVAAAWASPGVQSVVDEIVVAY